MNKMSNMDTDDAARELVQEYALDAPPEKVWRALSIPELRAQWLPGTEHAEPLLQVPQQELRLRLREAEPPLKARWTCRSAPAPMAARCCASSMC